MKVTKTNELSTTCITHLTMGVGKVLPMSPPKAREFTPALSHGFNGAAMALNDSD
jgi:hypothetical protein